MAIAVNDVLQKRSSVAGRTGVGRVQWPPLAPDVQSDGFVDDDFLTVQMSDLADELSTAQVITGLYTAVLRPCLPAGGANHNYDVWDAVPQDTIRTMHRRTVGLGI
jgi:hypothetical protein